MNNVEKDQNCIGFFGFGAGYVMGKNGPSNTSQESYCSSRCSVRDECWKKHRAHVATLIPDLTAEFERRAQTTKGPALMKQWFDDFGIGDPYTTVMLGHIEDGIRIAGGFAPKDRGIGTLVYPFARHV